VSTSVSRPVQQLWRFGRLWWLPANGYGNGLDDDGWAPILEVDARITAPLLESFRAAGVPAYAAPVHPRSHALAAFTERWPAYRVWVGTSAYARAEQTLLSVMPALTRQLDDAGATRTDLRPEA